MSIKDYEHYLDENHGVVPEHWMSSKDSFNNVVYHAHLLIAREVNHKLTRRDIDLFRAHLAATVDDKGLYKPKNSKDNLIAKTAACYLYGLDYELDRMDLKYMVTSSYLNPWDAIFYIYCKSNKLIKWLITPLLVCITYLQMWRAIRKSRKVRPKTHQRVWWTLTGKEYELREYINDGKHLALLKTYALRKEFPRLTKFIRGQYLKRYKPTKKGDVKFPYPIEDSRHYPYIIFYSLFRDKGHPIISEYKAAKMFNREPFDAR